MKKLLVLAAGPLQAPVIKRAREMGIYVIAADANPEAVGLKLADKAVVTDICSEEGMLAIAREEHINGMLHPCTEVAMNVLGRINDELHLNGISRATALKATNKHLMREAFARGGAPNPRSMLATDADHAWCLFHDEMVGDAILKPTRNSGSRGISKVERGIGRRQFERQYRWALRESRDNGVLVEQFIDGPEFSVEAIVWQGEPHILAITDKKTTGAPFFVELGHNQPSVYPEDVLQKLRQATIAGIRALGLQNCAVHSELKMQHGQAYLMEIGARMGGDFIATELVRLSTGIDMVQAAIQVALGQEPDFLKHSTTPAGRDSRGVCIRYFTPAPGILRAIENEELLKDPTIYDACIYRQVGDEVPEVRSSLDRSGHVIVTADTAMEAIAKAEQITQKIKLRTSPPTTKPAN